MTLLVSGTPRGRWISTGVPKLTAKTKVNSRCRQVMMPREKPGQTWTPTGIFDSDIIPYSGAWPWSKSTMHCSTEHSIFNPFINMHLKPKVYKTLNELTLFFIKMMVTYKSVNKCICRIILVNSIWNGFRIHGQSNTLKYSLNWSDKQYSITIARIMFR